MKKFTILEKRELIEYTRYTIEAESEEEAIYRASNIEDIDEEVDDYERWTKEVGLGASIEIIEIKSV